MFVLSHFQTAPLLQARLAGLKMAASSLDLGRSRTDIPLEPDGVVLPDGQRLPWADIEEITNETSVCFEIRENRTEPVRLFSEALQRSYSLMPTLGAPTMLVSGFPMHRIKDVEPAEDTRRKIQTVSPIRGDVLDTTTGLGYTAIAAARTAQHVVTIEIDPAAQEIAHRNPWSQELFGNPRIEQLIGNASDIVPGLRDAAFSRILHDPPTFRLAGELYSGEFYRHLFRLLKPGGRLFHYIGNPESRHGRVIARGVVRRLHESGFARVSPAREAFGVVAHKG